MSIPVVNVGSPANDKKMNEEESTVEDPDTDINNGSMPTTYVNHKARLIRQQIRAILRAHPKIKIDQVHKVNDKLNDMSDAELEELLECLRDHCRLASPYASAESIIGGLCFALNNYGFIDSDFGRRLLSDVDVVTSVYSLLPAFLLDQNPLFQLAFGVLRNLHPRPEPEEEPKPKRTKVNEQASHTPPYEDACERSFTDGEDHMDDELCRE